MKNCVAFVMMNNAVASLFLVDIVPLAMTVHRGTSLPNIFVCML